MRFIIVCLALASQVFASDAVLAKWLDRQSSISSLETSFIQERKLPALKEPVTTPGRLTFSKPANIRWQLGEPPQTLAISDGATLTLVDETEKSARQIPADSPRAARFSLLTGKAFQSASAFEEAFQIVETRVVSGIHQYTLKPNDRRLRSQAPWIFIDIDPRKNELRALEIELQDKSRLRTVFHNPVFNRNISSGLFKPDLTGYSVK